MIASTDWISAARLIPVLSHAGCSVSIVAPKRSALHQTGGIDHAVVCGDSIEDTVDAALNLIDNAQTPFDYIQIADDPLLWYLTDHRDEERFRRILPFDPTTDVGEIITNKHSFTDRLSGGDFKVVPGRGAANNQEAIDAADQLGYPVILKPSRGSGGNLVVMHESGEKLRAYLKEIPIVEPYVVQRFVKGRVALVEALLDHGRPCCWTVSYKTKTLRDAFGGSSAREMFTVSDIEEQLCLFGEATGLHGFFGLDFIHEQGTGDIYFIEVNARQTSGHLFGWCMGADYAKAFAAMLDGRDEKYPPVEHRLDGLRIRAFPADVCRAIYSSDALSLITAPFDPALWRDIRSQNMGLFMHGCQVVWRSVKRKVRHILGRFKRKK